MKKKKTNLKERLKKAKNPLAGVKTRDLIITLLVLLICFFSGFFGGYACNQSCKRVEASADTETAVQPFVFNAQFSSFMITGRLYFYREYTPIYLTNSQWLALADDNSISPYRYVTEQIVGATSEAGNFGLEILPNANNVEYEIYCTYTSTEEPSYLQYDAELVYGDYSVLTYSNLSQGGFSGKLSYFFTCKYGFGIVLENGSYWFVQMEPIPQYTYDSIDLMIQYGVGNIYSYDDVFGLTSDESYQAGFVEGFEQGAEQGLEAGRAAGYSDGYNDGYGLGFTAGETVGYNQGISETLEDITPWQHIVNGVNAFLNIEVFPNVRLSLILSISFGVILLGFGIKIFLGG